MAGAKPAGTAQVIGDHRATDPASLGNLPVTQVLTPFETQYLFRSFAWIISLSASNLFLNEKGKNILELSRVAQLHNALPDKSTYCF